RFPQTIAVYEDLIADPERAVAQLAAKLQEWEGLSADPLQLEAAVAQIRPELDHGDDAPEQDDHTSAEHTALYERLTRHRLDASAPKIKSGVSKELVRLEQAHQNAKAVVDSLRTELAHRSAALSSERSRI